MMFCKKLTCFLGAILLSCSQFVFCQELDLEATVQKLVQKKRENIAIAKAQSRPDLYSLMKDEVVRNEVGLSDDQLAKLEEIDLDFDQVKADIGRDFFNQLRELGEAGTPVSSRITDGFEAELESIHQESTTLKGTVLSPGQIKRLKEIATQVHVRRAGYAAAMTHPESAKTLRLSEDQQKQIRARSREITKKLEADIQKLKEKAREELLSELSPKQRKLFDEQMGEPILLDKF
ncbi:MAG: hypothetical protein AAGA30_11830 [Planctomycetota bacterium]